MRARTGSRPVPLAERFWDKVDRRGPDECWLWLASDNGAGYGQIARGSGTGMALAHRVSYEFLVGPIPEGMTLDHLCRTPRCVNPAHLDPVPLRENILRGVSPAAQAARKTHCKHGHPFDSKNTYIDPDGIRRCRECARLRQNP